MTPATIAPTPLVDPKKVEAARKLSGAKCMPGYLRTAEQSDHAALDYETQHPWESILAENYFLPCASWFVDGRRRWLPRIVRVIRHVAAEQRHWWEMAELIVTYADPGKRVEVEVLKQPFAIGAPQGVGCSYDSKKKAA